MKITVVGLGHLGTVAAAGLAMAGHQVTGVDVDRRRIRQLQEGVAPIYEPGLGQWMTDGVDRGCLSYFHVNEFTGPLGEVVMVTVGTPATDKGEADLRQVRSALAWVRGRNPGEPGPRDEEHRPSRQRRGLPPPGPEGVRHRLCGQP